MQYCQKWVSLSFLCTLLPFLTLCSPLFPFLPSLLAFLLALHSLACLEWFSKTSLILARGGIKNRPFIWIIGVNYPSTNFLANILFIEVCTNSALTCLSKVQCFIHYYIHSELESYHKAVHTTFLLAVYKINRINRNINRIS